MRRDANKKAPADMGLASELRFLGLPRRSLLLATVVLTGVFGACAPRGQAIPAPDILAVVDEVERAIVERDYGRAHALVDYRHRLDEVLGELWRSGSDADRDDLVGLARAMLEDTSEKHRERFAGRPMERRLTSRTRLHQWVESRPLDDEGFAWRYRLTRRGTSWAITVREFKVSGALNDSTRFWHMAQSQLTSRFGRPITLREFTANLPSVMGTFRARSVRIPAMPGRTP
jgi:hypothetical protein